VVVQLEGLSPVPGRARDKPIAQAFLLHLRPAAVRGPAGEGAEQAQAQAQAQAKVQRAADDAGWPRLTGAAAGAFAETVAQARAAAAGGPAREAGGSQQDVADGAACKWRRGAAAAREKAAHEQGMNDPAPVAAVAGERPSTYTATH
jgi:hypothetical protein